MGAVTFNPDVPSRDGSMRVWIWWPSIDYIAFKGNDALDDLNLRV
jgi:hypothetical protein